MKRFIGILQFLTRITINKNLPFDEEFQKGIIYFPMVGFILGILQLIFYYLADLIMPHTMAVVLTVIFYILLTGGLHLDGLGDTFDGLYSNRPRERVLEIMKDSRLGTNALLTIMLVIIIKLVALVHLQEYQLYIALLLMPMVGRQALVFGCYNTPYARKEGMGNMFIGKVTSGQLLTTLFITATITLIHLKTFVFLPVLWIFIKWFKNNTYRIIGGMTGDTLGAVCELSETIYLIFLILQIKN